MRSLAPLLLLAACAPTPGPSRADAQLTEDLAGRTPGPAERCLPSSMQVAITIAGPRTLTYRRGDTLWVNRQERDCFGRGAPATLLIEQQGGSYCRGDRLRRLEPGSNIPGPVCLLNEWVPYRPRS